MTAPRTGTYPVVFTLFLLSGATGLIYEVVWLRQLILIFGSTQFATSAILSTFMAGLAIGAILAGRWLRGSAHAPLKIYGILEIGIGLYALAVPSLFEGLKPVYRALWEAGASESFIVLSLAKFAGIGLVLLPPTILMGASLPVLARQVADDPERIGGKVGGLYAINVFGAVAGVFLAGFFFVPYLGVHATVWITAAVNVAIGVTALVASRRVVAPRAPLAVETDAAAEPPSRSRAVQLSLVVFGLSGFGALVLEVAWTRVLALVLGSSVYAFSLMLLAFLVGLALGGAFFSARLRKAPDADPARLLAILLVASGLAAYGTAWGFQWLPRLFGEILIQWHGLTPNGWFAVQFGISLLVMFPTTFALGGIFPAVLQLHARRLDRVGESVGIVYASNTVGTILGAAAAGFILIPILGAMNTVVGTSLIQLGLGALVAVMLVADRPGRRAAVTIGAAALILLLFVARPTWNVVMMNSGVFNLYGKGEGTTWEEFWGEMASVEVIYEAEGLTGNVFVAYEEQYDNLFLSVNGKVEASTQSDLETQLMIAHLPLLFHEDPRDVLVIGLASGITVASVATHPVETIRILEIEKAMIGAAETFADHNRQILDDPRVELSINDARNELEFSSRTYDVVISEPSNPWMTVAANLFTEEFFETAKTRVRPGGIYCQWVQNYYLPPEDLRAIIAAFRKAFPHILLFEADEGVDLVLLGSQEPLEIDLAQLDTRISELGVRMDLATVQIRSAVDMVSRFRLGDREITEMVEGAARNTDNNARVEFSAPRALGMSTIPANKALLRRHVTSPLNYLKFDPDGPAGRDGLLLDLAEAWIESGDYDLADRAARRTLEGPLHERAEALLARLDAVNDEG